MYTDGSVTEDLSGWAFTVKQGATIVDGNSAVCKVSPKLNNGNWSSLSAGRPRGVTVRPVMPTSSQIQWAHSKKWKGKPILARVIIYKKLLLLRVSVRHLPSEDSCRWTPGVKGNDRQIDWREETTITSGLRFVRLKCWGAWDTTRGHRINAVATRAFPNT